MYSSNKASLISWLIHLSFMVSPSQLHRMHGRMYFQHEYNVWRIFQLDQELLE